MTDKNRFMEFGPEDDRQVVALHCFSCAILIERVRNWLAESPMSERISAKRCRELKAILDANDTLSREGGGS
jgi:hypothetical protein